MSATVVSARSATVLPGMWRVVAAALSGSSIEWYDFFLYGTAAATVFPALFFPKSDPVVGTLLSFSTFAIGFIARPVGGVIFGHFGDRLGRKRSLAIALLLMGCATTGIGLLPTYASIGVAAPILLVALRFAQGLAIGGQWGGAVLLLTESAPPDQRGFYGSFAQLGVPLGVILANFAFLGVTAATGQDAFLEWGWRVPFLLSIALIALGVFVQTRIEESPEFQRLRSVRVTSTAPKDHRSPILTVLREHPKAIVLAAGAFVAANGTFYVFITYSVAYATRVLGMPQTTVLFAVLLSSFVGVPSLLGFAALSDRIGRRKVLMAGAFFSALWSFAFFPLLETRTFTGALIGLSVGTMFQSAMYGPLAALFGELFRTEVRYSGASLGYQIGSIFGGAFAPLIATALLAKTGSSMSIGAYMALLCVVSFVSAGLMGTLKRAA
jgi:metabolite-proton symporter